MMKELLYYPGCTLKNTAKGFEDSALACAEKLGYKLKEMVDWYCCGTVYSLTSDDLMHHIASVRNLLKVQDAGGERFTTLCSMCYNTIKRSSIRINNDEEEREKLNSFMYKEENDYNGKVEMIHYLQILRDEIGFDKIKDAVKKPLNGIKLAPYYGCLLLRPDEAAIDNPDSPSILEDLITSMGAEPIYFPFKNECCGAYQTVSEVELVVERTRNIIGNAKRNGADAILVSCPLCAFNLDNRQEDVLAKYPDFENIPILYFTQALAVSFDLDHEVCHFELNYRSPEDLLRRIV
ncbi:CoB--CoM heterodisulfide reductase iron-sulfur subunit B family protein [candidate division WOR-3 bacterium]|nr:CoB--CoM heterodisulfide reductase iron-sulfur subunit B family protein [candidate division WOR-3 bacterium]